MAENNKTRFFYFLYSDKTRVFDQSERAYYPICYKYIYNLIVLVEFLLKFTSNNGFQLFLDVLLNFMPEKDRPD